MNNGKEIERYRRDDEASKGLPAWLGGIDIAVYDDCEGCDKVVESIKPGQRKRCPTCGCTVECKRGL